MSLVVKADVTFDPIHISIFGAAGVVFDADGGAELVEKFRGFGGHDIVVAFTIPCIGGGIVLWLLLENTRGPSLPTGRPSPTREKTMKSGICPKCAAREVYRQAGSRRLQTK